MNVLTRATLLRTCPFPVHLDFNFSKFLSLGARMPNKSLGPMVLAFLLTHTITLSG